LVNILDPNPFVQTIARTTTANYIVPFAVQSQLGGKKLITS
jgi:hypothetical protein